MSPALKGSLAGGDHALSLRRAACQACRPGRTAGRDQEPGRIDGLSSGTCYHHRRQLPLPLLLPLPLTHAASGSGPPDAGRASQSRTWRSAGLEWMGGSQLQRTAAASNRLNRSCVSLLHPPTPVPPHTPKKTAVTLFRASLWSLLQLQRVHSGLLKRSGGHQLYQLPGATDCWRWVLMSTGRGLLERKGFLAGQGRETPCLQPLARSLPLPAPSCPDLHRCEGTARGGSIWGLQLKGAPGGLEQQNG